MGYRLIPLSRHVHYTNGGQTSNFVTSIKGVLCVNPHRQVTKRCKNDRPHYHFWEKYLASHTLIVRLRSTSRASPRVGELNAPDNLVLLLN